MKKSAEKTRSSLFSKGHAGKRYLVEDLLGIMAKLRSPSGCPWDREQSEHTLKKYLMEETYEVLETIEAGSFKELSEELGDLLLQIVFLCRIAEEKGQFNFPDVVDQLAAKLVRRHPHVFPNPDHPSVHPRTAREVTRVWGAAKEKEGKYARRNSLLDGIPLALPALERARRISDRASRAGFDWPNIGEVWKKVEEELEELRAAEKEISVEAVEEELGDLLFSLVNLARFQRISAEEALRKANRRFAQRFFQVELGLRRRGRRPEEATLEEMDELWNQAKKRGVGSRRLGSPGKCEM
jgi:tetrapyrrole methylase family protein/MazG family protein